MLEREHELVRQDETLARVREGRSAIRWYTGPPGIGKSTLLAEAARRAAACGLPVLSGSGHELEQPFSFGVVLQLLEPAAQRATPEERDRIFAGAAALARPLLLHEDGPGHGSTAPLYPVVHSLYWVVANLAERTPLVIIVDDLQWADEASVRFLAYLASRLGDVRVALLGAARSGAEAHGDPIRSLLGHRDATSVQVEPLSEDAVTDLVGGGASDDDDLRRALHRLTAGNPLLVHELLENLATIRSLEDAVPGDGPAVDGGPTNHVLPTVVSRLARLPAPAAHFAAACAVLADGSGLDAAATLSELAPTETARVHRTLVEAAILTDDPHVQFVHQLVRDSVLTTVDRHRRAELHARAAAVLDQRGAAVEQVAAHLAAADPGGLPWAVDVLRRAATRSLRAGEPATAVRWLRRAMQEGSAEVDRGALLFDLAVAEAAADDPAWRARRDEALARTPDPLVAAARLLQLGQVLGESGALADAVKVLASGLDLLAGGESSPDAPDELRDLHLQLLAAYATYGSIDLDTRDEVRGRVHRWLAPRTLGSSLADRALLASLAYEAAIDGGRAGGPTAAEVTELASKALGIVEGEVRGPLPPQLYMAVLALEWCDQLDLAELVLQRVIDRARQRGDVIGVARAAGYRAPVGLRRCRPGDAASDAELALGAFPLGWRATAPGAAGNLARARLALDDLDAAEAALELPDGPTRWEPTASYTYWLLSKAEVELAHGRVDGALTALEECDRRQARMGAVNPNIMPWHTLIALALARTDRGTEAADRAAEELALAERFGAPPAVASALRTAALVGPIEERVVTLERSVEVAATSASVIEHVRSQIELGAALRRARNSVAAREPLRAALATAEERGAFALAERARAELAAAGAKPRRAALTGVAALTPSEKRVSELAAAGRRNRQIAEELFVSVKAVEFHLGNAFRKLGISRRDELPDAVGT